MGLDIVEMIVRVEEEFEVQIPNDTAETFVTPKRIIDYLNFNSEIGKNGMTREDIRIKIFEIIEDETGLQPNEFSEDSRFVEDLNMD